MPESSIPIRVGRFHPLGATFDGDGVNFALFSEHATAVDLCLFDEAGNETRVALPQRTIHVWHGYVRGLRPGQRYAFRVHGRYAPEEGLRFNPNKLLIDPYARALDGKVDPKGAIYGFANGPRRAPKRDGESGVDDGVRREGADDIDDEDLVMDTRDDRDAIPKCVVVDERFDWEGDTPPDVRWDDTIIYEAHVKGFTMRHHEVPAHLRGTFAGLATPPAIAHLKKLGVTAIELLPVHEAMDEPAVTERGLVNYWGYNTLAFFAPAQRLAADSRDVVREFKSMVKALHAAGIEVLLDVVYNHTCEGDRFGPTVSFRGIDNAAYYRLKKDPRRYEDFTGCGNSVNAQHPQTLKLIMDSLRYWVTEMHVDGFRFDLATTLGRDDVHAADRRAAFFDIIHQDPVLSAVKLIAEPWDLGPDGYQVGNFPVLWSEWNGRFRDTVRRFWTGSAACIPDLGYRLTGSSDLFGDDGRQPHASINFVTAHDGFTMHDLVTYEKKRNLANGEENRDGWDDNGGWNCGVEGETSDVEVNAVRQRQVRNLLATLILSQGVPMLTMGDEVGRTQRGNNNAYCQDNEISWMDWDLDAKRRALFAFTSALIALRRGHPVFRRRTFFNGERPDGVRGGQGVKDIVWMRPDGREMTDEDWREPKRALIGLALHGELTGLVDDAGATIHGETFFLILNADDEAIVVSTPGPAWASEWEVALDTGSGGGAIGTSNADSSDAEREAPAFGPLLPPGAPLTVQAHAFVALLARREKPHR